MADCRPSGGVEGTAAPFARRRERIALAIAALPAGDIRRLRGPERLWRLRVGDWRVIFERDDEQRTIDVLAVRPRGRAYR